MNLAIAARVDALDILIVAVLLVGACLGTYQGVIRQLCLAVAVYFAIVLAAQYYQFAGKAIEIVVPGAETRAYSVVGLLAVFMVAAAAITGLSYLAYSRTNRMVLPLVERTAGALVGMAVAALTLSVCLTSAQFANAAGTIFYQGIDSRLVSDSALLPVINRSMPLFYETIRPWLPAGLPAVFS